jgi:hypothetical protein
MSTSVFHQSGLRGKRHKRGISELLPLADTDGNHPCASGSVGLAPGTPTSSTARPRPCGLMCMRPHVRPQSLSRALRILHSRGSIQLLDQRREPLDLSRRSCCRSVTRP